MYYKRLFLIISIYFVLSLKLTIYGQLSDTIPLSSVNFSPYTELGLNPNHNDSIPDSLIICLLDTLDPWVKGIRTFGTQNGLQNIPRLAKERGLKVILGIWLGKEIVEAGKISNETQIANGIAIAKAGFVDKIFVGSEVLLRKDLPASKLIEYINQVQVACPDIPISCADIDYELLNNPEVVDACDFLAVNVYPFWSGVSIDCAIQNFHQRYLDLVDVSNGKEIFISESGWKTEGEPVGLAVPSLENAIRYNRELLGWSETFGVEVNLFAAFEEPWKLPNDGGWGIFSNDKTMKPGMDILFTPFESIDSTWLCFDIDNSSIDTIKFDYIPAIGSSSDLKGRVNYINPCDYRLATYIKVGSKWWTKPTFANKTVAIDCNGNWTVDVTTGGQDINATDICVFVFSREYNPPSCSGCFSLPEAIYQNALSSKCVTRYELDSAMLDIPSDTICRGDTITLTATGGNTYLWNTGDTTSSITVSPTNNSYYRVEITDGMGGGAIFSELIRVFRPVSGIYCHPSKICPGDTTSISVTEGYSYLWNTGDTSSVVSVSTIIDSTFTVTITDEHGCSITKSQDIEVLKYPSEIHISRDTICLGKSTLLWCLSCDSNIIWNTGDTTKFVSVSPDSTTYYHVTALSSRECQIEQEGTVFISDPSLSLTIDSDTIVSGQTSIISAFSDIGTSFKWSTGDTTSTIHVSPTSTTSYSVTVSDDHNCKKVETIDLVVNTATNIDNPPDRSLFKLYPNPTKAVLHIDLENADLGRFEVVIYDYLGQNVMPDIDLDFFNRSDYKIDLSDLPPGVYFVKLKFDNGNQWIEKIVKR